MNRKVPKLSLLSYAQGQAQDRLCFIDQLILGLKDYGFIILTDHLVDQNKVDQAYEYLHKFFELQEVDKLKIL